jgi:phage baseplate assembly protein gpV
VFVVFAGLFAPGTLAADPRSDLAPVRSLRRLTQTPVGYLQSTKLTADDGAGTDEFGKSVSIDGDTIVIGAWHDDDKGSNSGSAYVFTRTRCWNETTGDVSSSYTQVAKLTADDGAGKFGISVSIDGDTIVIEAGNDDSAYVFTRDTAGDLASGWTQVAKLVADDGAGGDSFGNSVSINGDTIVIGADHSDNMGTDSGSAYVFTRDTAGDLASGWTQVAKLTADDAAVYDQFGISVSIDGDTIVIGARKDDDGPRDSGSAYVFTRDTAGDLASGWTQVTKLHADDRNQHDHFGTSVSVDGGMIVIGALFHDANGLGDSGSAYVYTLASDSTSLTRPCSCCDSKMVSRGFNKACNFELAGVPHCQI